MKYGICKKLVPVMLVMFLLFGCDKKDEDPTQIPEKFKPELNPHPKYFFTFKGEVAEALAKDLSLVFGADYYTHNKECKVIVNSWAGVSGPRLFSNEWDININSKGKYRLTIPLDKYIPGKCKWKLVDVYYKYVYKNFKRDADTFSSLAFTSKKIKNKHLILQNWRCGNVQCTLGKESFSDMQQRYSRNKNFEFAVNFKEKGESN